MPRLIRGGRFKIKYHIAFMRLKNLIQQKIVFSMK